MSHIDNIKVSLITSNSNNDKFSYSWTCVGQKIHEEERWRNHGRASTHHFCILLVSRKSKVEEWHDNLVHNVWLSLTQENFTHGENWTQIIPLNR